MDYDEIRAKLKVRLEAVSSPQSFVAVFDNIPDSVVVPCAIIVPSQNVVSYHDAMGAVNTALSTCFFDVLIVAQRFEAASNQELLNDYLSTVPVALEADQTLGGEATAVQVMNARNYGPISFADSVFLGLEFDLEVLV